MKESFSKAQVTIRDYLFIIFHRKNFFLIPALIVFFTASIGSFFLPKYYTSSVLVLVQEEGKVINPLASRPTYVPTTTPTLVEQLKTLTEKILNYPQLLMVIKELGLDKFINNPLELEKLIRSIRKRVKIKLRSAEVFEVSYEDKDPKMVQQLVNALVTSFIDYNIAKKQELALTGVKFAESQVQIYKEKLKKSEKALYEFKNKYSLQSPGKDTDINVSLLINYQTQLTSTDLSIAEINKELDVVNRQLKGIEPVAFTREVIEVNPIIDSLNEQVKDTQLMLDDLLLNDPSSSKVVELQLRIDDLRRRLAEETTKMIDNQVPQTHPVLFCQLEGKKKTIDRKLKDLYVRQQEYKKLVQEYEMRIASLPEQERIYADLMRDNRVNNNIYEMLMLKIEENRLDAVELQQRGINYEILERGRIPLKPSKPQKLIISIIAFILGILTGLGCVFVVELGDHSFRNIEDARRFLDVPVIGSTMKIVTLGQLYVERKKQRRTTIIVIVLLVVFIVGAVISSNIQEKKLSEKIVREQLMQQK